MELVEEPVAAVGRLVREHPVVVRVLAGEQGRPRGTAEGEVVVVALQRHALALQLLETVFITRIEAGSWSSVSRTTMFGRAGAASALLEPTASPSAIASATVAATRAPAAISRGPDRLRSIDACPASSAHLSVVGVALGGGASSALRLSNTRAASKSRRAGPAAPQGGRIACRRWASHATLARSDPVLAGLIERLGRLSFETRRRGRPRADSYGTCCAAWSASSSRRRRRRRSTTGCWACSTGHAVPGGAARRRRGRCGPPGSRGARSSTCATSPPTCSPASSSSTGSASSPTRR